MNTVFVGLLTAVHILISFWSEIKFNSFIITHIIHIYPSSHFFIQPHYLLLLLLTATILNLHFLAGGIVNYPSVAVSSEKLLFVF